MRNKFIDLKRHLSKLSTGKDNDENYETQIAFGTSKAVTWSDVLEKRRVVVLAEAGAGKTEELKNAASCLRQRDKQAFFLRLENVSANFELAFDVGTFSEFQKWLQGEDDAWFFLDSVDEARLRSPKDFELAVRKFADNLGGRRQRSHIYIASRPPPEWRPNSDLSLFKVQLPFYIQTEQSVSNNDMDKCPAPNDGAHINFATPPETEKKILDPEVLALAPLSNEQIKRFAVARGMRDADRFIDEIIRNDAWMFASRPLDLIDLIEFWDEHKRIDSRFKLLRANIEKKLSETDPDRADAHPIAKEKAKTGAELLAAATTLQRTSRICVHDNDHKSAGIFASDILQDWDESEIRALLNRAIFDPEIYGTIRFHHREYREFLCAEWLFKLLNDGKSRCAIESLLFTRQYGLDFVVPAMRPILPWIALWDDRIRVIAMEIAPELLIEGGDPSQLPVELRRRLLERFCEEYSDKTFGYNSFDFASLKRFSHSDLATCVEGLLEKHKGSEEICSLLLRMIWQGRMAPCWHGPKSIALDQSKNIYTRITALRAISAIGSDPQIREIINELSNTLDVKSPQIASELIEYYAPKFISVDWILSSIELLPAPEQFDSGPLGRALDSYIPQCPIDELGQLIEGFLRLLKQPPVIDRRFFEVSENNAWLLRHGEQAAERLVVQQHPDALCDDVIAMISLSSAAPHFDNYRSADHKLGKLVPAWPELNQNLFWHDVAQIRLELDKEKGERLVDWWRVGTFRDYCKFGKDDFDWITSEITSRSLPDDRLVALSLAFQIYRDNERPRKWRARLKKIVAGDQELETALRGSLHPPPASEETKKSKRQEAGWKRRQREREGKEAKRHADWRNWLSKNMHVLRDTSNAKEGKIWRASYYLRERLAKLGEDHNHWARSNWRDLIPDYGNDIAEAFRDGATDYWRKYAPRIRSEGVENPNSILHGIVLGLTGLEIEAREDPNWIAKLSLEEVRLACRYALWEMNGFPSWLKQLHGKYPEVVTEALLKEIQWEILETESDGDSHYVASDIQPYGEWIRDDIAPGILEIMAKTAPANLRLFRDCLKILIDSPTIGDGSLQEMSQIGSLNLKYLEHQPMWFSVWVSVDADAALNALEKHLAAFATPDEATEFAMKFSVALLGGRFDGLASDRDSFKTPGMLHRLHALLHKYISTEDDIDRSGKGVFTPELRDDAQRARDHIFSLLKDIPGKATYLALCDIAQNTPDENIRKWMNYHAKQRAEADADIEPWRDGDVQTFAREAERSPQNHRELFDLVLSRLLDLKSELEGGDGSNAKILIRSDQETEHRNYIGSWLRDRAKGRYSTPQEEELVDAKRPDIRVHGAGFDGPVPIELKLADNGWSGPTLFERLENQLCGDYLRDDRSNCGVYLLLYRGEQQHWKHPHCGKSMNFPELVTALKDHANQHIQTRADIKEIAVIGIDLTARARRPD